MSSLETGRTCACEEHVTKIIDAKRHNVGKDTTTTSTANVVCDRVRAGVSRIPAIRRADAADAFCVDVVFDIQVNCSLSSRIIAQAPRQVKFYER